MGIPICMAALPPADLPAVRRELSAYAEHKGGAFRPSPGALAPERRLILGRGDGGRTVIFFPKGFVECDEAAQRFSEALHAAAFSFKLDPEEHWWSYRLYSRGTELDRYSPWPAQGATAGNPSSVVVYWRTGSSADLERYYVDHGRRDCAAKAYPTDESTQCSEWQLLDFMKKLRLTYPVDERGNALGAEYRFDWGR